LKDLVSGGEQPVRRLKRAQILLASDLGQSEEGIAKALSVGISTVYRTRRRFVEANLEGALSEEPRAGAARKLKGNEEVLLVATAFGVLLPVPMAFDVIVCSVLLNSGMPVHVVAALLVTLGIYSVYAWSLLGTTLSWRIAGLAGAVVFAMGIAAGAAAGELFDKGSDADKDSVDRLKGVVKENPQQVAMVLKNWIKER